LVSGFLQRLKGRKLVQWAIALARRRMALGDYDCGNESAAKP
jgi:hypothetical protein